METVEQYLENLPDARKEVVNKMRDVMAQNLPDGFVEEMNYGMIGYVVPHEIYPKGYHCDPTKPLPFINIGSQKNFIGFYHLGIYSDNELKEWFVNEYKIHCKRKLDMGKSCIRFKYLDDVPYELLGELVSKITPEKWVEYYEKQKNKR